MDPLVYRVDFHCHTKYSHDSVASPQGLVNRCAQMGLGRVVITDHNTIEGALEAQQLDPVHMIVGEEIMTRSGELLAVFVKEVVPAGLSAQETIQILRDQDAFISISHPFDHYRKGSWSLDDLISILPWVDAVEGFNSRCMFKDANKQAIQFAARYNLAMTAGSDAHAAFELGAASVSLKSFANAEDLRKVIREGKVTGQPSPWWVHLVSSYAKIGFKG